VLSITAIRTLYLTEQFVRVNHIGDTIPMVLSADFQSDIFGPIT
jgi:hypothetical protein